ncbi:metal ABC transporter permease [Streptococcus suis]|uniref:metal ABC transporter permease n=1 Tax=Streptococcus suis TaxID=1307 RepID=UPI00211CE2FF|nr:metal ABC transporter permease [Streptococcus suis]MCQ9225683.1 metal ABC transporter permease [Streptococcus suis]MCQ9228028.1 metal ABC transporter permease [Streptococcus suis]MCQ9242016.1 metal ABC transporter permease [Streptococcus suis]MCQ9274249.1 metal ABC transporter permease [Streptococcus suis]MDE7534637.1 metal ABC transporter permease [Streptococcus suis]
MLEVLLILLAVGSSCGLIGSVLVVRNQAMLADALSHSVLLGIVLGFFVSHSLDSPLLLFGAAVFGLLTVLAIEGLHTRKLAQDAATGLLFTFFFALAVILISLFARNVHLDLDMVLMGEVLFAPLNRLDLFGLSLPLALVKSVGLLLVLLVFFFLNFQALTLYLLDKEQAKLQGIATKRLELGLIFLVSLTTVSSFEAVGSMAVIVFLVAPSMAALPWSKHFCQFLVLGQCCAILMIVLGFGLASWLDLTMSGTCSVMGLLTVCVSFFLKNALKT